MFAKRIIPCLDVKDGRVVKGINFVNLRDAGDPVEQARAYDKMGADELVFLDISATPEGHQTTLAVVQSIAEQVFLPLTVGGGIRELADIRQTLLSGADKDNRWEVYVSGGRIPTGLDAVQWAVDGVNAGAGEILLTSMDRDGTRDGYDLELTETIASAVSVPVIASGGAGSKQDFLDVFSETQAEAALAATLFHDKILAIGDLKGYLSENQIPIRLVNESE
jgi:cyclase